MNNELIKESRTIVQVLNELKEWVEKYPVTIRYNSPSKLYDKIYKSEVEAELDRLIKLYEGKE